MKKLIAVFLALLLGFVFFAVPLPQSMAAPVVAYDFLANALNASWNGWTASKAAPITFNQTSFKMIDGMAALYGKAPNPTGVSLEDGNKHAPALWTVAPGGPGITGGTGITGDYYHIYIPNNATLEVTFGLTKGDTGEKGITVGIAFADDDPSYPLVELIKETKDYDGILRKVTVDLSSEGGRTGGFQLFVRTSHPDDSDGVVWVKAAIEVTTPPPPVSPLVLHFYVGNASYLVDTTPKTMDTAPVILDSRTFLPIRYVAQELGATVDWVQSEQKVTLTLSGKKIELWIGKNTASVNGSFVLIDPGNPNVAPFIQPPGRTMMPLRFISENLGCKVEWFQTTQEARVTYPAP